MTAAISPQQVREVLADEQIFASAAAELGEDTEFVLDSVSLVWLLHLARQRFGVQAQPSDEQLSGFTSISAITSVLNEVR